MENEIDILEMVSDGHYLTMSDTPGSTIYKGEPSAALLERTSTPKGDIHSSDQTNIRHEVVTSIWSDGFATRCEDGSSRLIMYAGAPPECWPRDLSA